MPRPPTRLLLPHLPQSPRCAPPSPRTRTPRLLQVLARSLALGLVLSLAAWPQRADAEDAPEGTRVVIPGVPAEFVMPRAASDPVQSVPEPGEWIHQCKLEGVQLLVRVFPAKVVAEPKALLVQAVRRELRSRGSQTTAISAQKDLRLFGHPAASLHFQGVFQGTPRSGRARLLRLPPQWVVMGFCLQTGGGTLPPASIQAMDAFLDSLVPSRARFFTPRFAPTAAERATALWSGSGATLTEPAVTNVHLDALLLCMEAGMERRLAQYHRGALRACLVRELAQADAAGRAGLRGGVQALAIANQAEGLARLATLGAYGNRVREALRKRSLERHLPALCALAAEARALRAGLDHGDAASTDVRAHAERAAFLVSLRFNAEAMAPGFATEHKAYWNELVHNKNQPELAELRDVGVAWADLRAAWDAASPDARFAFRRAACAALSSAPESWRAIADSRALRARMDRGSGKPAPALEAALRLRLGDYAALRALLPAGPGPWAGSP